MWVCQLLLCILCLSLAYTHCTYISIYIVNWGAQDAWSSAPQLMLVASLPPFIIGLPYDGPPPFNSQQNTCMCVCILYTSYNIVITIIESVDSVSSDGLDTPIKILEQLSLRNF